MIKEHLLPRGFVRPGRKIGNIVFDLEFYLGSILLPEVWSAKLSPNKVPTLFNHSNRNLNWSIRKNIWVNFFVDTINMNGGLLVG